MKATDTQPRRRPKGPVKFRLVLASWRGAVELCGIYASDRAAAWSVAYHWLESLGYPDSGPGESYVVRAVRK